MTRFMIDTDTAIDLIEKALTVSGYNLIPDIPSFKVSDLFEAFTVVKTDFLIGGPCRKLYFEDEEV